MICNKNRHANAKITVGTARRSRFITARPPAASGMAGCILSTAIVLSAVTMLSGCARPVTQQSQDQQIQQQAAKTTQDVKQGAQDAAAEAKVAAANAGRELKDIASGVREGLHNGDSGDASSGKPNAGRLDLNSASQQDLAALPGISDSKAQEIIEGRPYGSSHDLVAKGILSESHYERIARKVTAR